MIFNVNFNKWVALMLPTFLRRRRLYAFCRALCSPLYIGEQSLYRRLLAARSDHIYRLSHNGQVCYLRAALNDAFGLTRGFEIEDYGDFKGEWLYAKDSVMPQQLHAVDEQLRDKDHHPVPLLADEARLNAPHNCFVVRVPANIYSLQLDKVKSIVEQYRIRSKQPIYTTTRHLPTINEHSGIYIDGDRIGWQWPVSVVNPGSVVRAGSDYLFTGTRKNRR